MRSPHRLVRFENPVAAHDGRHVAFEVVTGDAEKFDLEVPLVELGAVIEYLVGLATHVGVNEAVPQKIYSPIPVQGLGLATGRDANETLLVVRLAGCELAFSLDSTKVAELGGSFARTAQVLSAPGNIAQ